MCPHPSTNIWTSTVQLHLQVFQTKIIIRYDTLLIEIRQSMTRKDLKYKNTQFQKQTGTISLGICTKNRDFIEHSKQFNIEFLSCFSSS